MGIAATADVVVRSQQKGKKVYDDLEKQLDGLKKRILQVGSAAGVATAAGVAVLTAKSFESADALAKQADKIGISTERLASLNRLAEMSGGSVNLMQESLVKATKRLGEFNATGGGAAATWLKRLNLDTRELAELSPDQLFAKYSESIRSLSSRGEQLAAISALMGDESRALIGVIDQGTESFEASFQEVQKYALALDRVDSAKIEAANDAMFKVRERMTGVGNVIASKVAPVVTAMANRFLDTTTEADVMGATVDKVMNGMATGAGLVGDAIYGWKLIFAGIRVGMLEFSADAISGFANIERAVVIVRNKMSEAFGGEIIDVRGGFLSRVEDSLRASSEHASQVLHELAQTERPSLKIADALAKARVEAEASAIAVASTRARLQEISAPSFDESDADERARERDEAAAARLQERLSNKVAAIEQSLLTEEQREIESFERRREILGLALEQSLLTKERAMEIEAELLARHEERLNQITKKALSDREKFEAKSGTAKAKQIFGDLQDITSGVSAHNKTMFRINQAAAIGNAIVNTSEAITEMLKLPWPLNFAMAAVAGAAGLAQVAAIKSTPYGGGGSVPSVSGTGGSASTGLPAARDAFSPSSAVTAPSAPQSQITINVEGSLIGDQGIRDVLAQTLGELIDQDAIIISPESTQAAVIRGGTGR